MNTPAPRTTRRERVEARERAILAAARAAFEAGGYEGARMADIARAAGTAEGTVYTYFPNKDALLRGVLDDFWAGLREEAQAAAAGADGDAFARLAALARRHLDLCLANFDFIELSLALNAPRGRDPATRDHMRGYVAVFDEILRAGAAAGEVRAGVETWLARDLFYGALEYAARTMRLRGATDPGPAVAHLIGVMRAAYAAEAGAAAAPDLAARIGRLERAARAGAERVRPARRARRT